CAREHCRGIYCYPDDRFDVW
nr:immunoglobulin heavy chain junction region [Macaca mulatta]